uniref:Uncharacterized protein n=1 Tax=Pyxicephalus adspersus TaxID=30357 RepID=A0AAV3B8I5_PYXAD|nr:TPA: hypothetical protein GDO54_002125 [Pyxicephalus adspersus]
MVLYTGLHQVCTVQLFAAVSRLLYIVLYIFTIVVKVDSLLPFSLVGSLNAVYISVLRIFFLQVFPLSCRVGTYSRSGLHFVRIFNHFK